MPGKTPETRTIKVDLVARVEGEGALHVTVKDGVVEDVQLRIFEPPRFFEAFLQGRHFSEVPDIVARICGICPVAYQMSAVHALESIFGVTVDGALRDLRRLLYCAEWIESHTLHIYMLHGPDFLGFHSGIEMAKEHPDIVKRGLRLKKAGNDLLALLGGRSVHPVSVKVGGFSKVPSKNDFAIIRDDLLWARDAAIETVKWVAGFEFKDPEQDYRFVSLHSSAEYPMNEGQITSSNGLNIAATEFEQHFLEHQVPYSHALQCTLNGASYFVGPLARFHLNYNQLPTVAKQTLEATGLRLPFTRASMSIIARAVEVLFAVEESLRIIEGYQPPSKPAVAVEIKPGEGMAATEAPRGTLYHRYLVREDGSIQEAKIVPPTSQNQVRIEEDLRTYLPVVLHLSNKEAAINCEKIIRSYDPCISCATHFLKLDIEHIIGNSK
ncbi:Ni/Fe hydrogenase subunit alpha [Candidatus Nitronereus thalassa]|uniref:Ni/Fe hydrogenase subunit alpha n=1 Tax=Candidatus Nitronereus thalassa TaxID=3020898 RepID=A0ABU3K8Y9_9BACT|nr:Ni/Fe hydrogenase subunit alpha [Candidatus Nitronereus thalassa]MDT7042834.1 Ni/Fe hydrogenase subunit alpha [Candidatus Nitronereus thalassa]